MQKFSVAALGGAVVALAFLLISVLPAQARNIPGSAAVAQNHVTTVVGSSLIDLTFMALRDAGQPTYSPAAGSAIPLGYLASAAQPENSVISAINSSTMLAGSPESTSLSAAIGAGYVFGAPNGFDFNYGSTYGSLVLAHSVSPDLRLFGSLVMEAGSGDLLYNNGTLSNTGVGGLAGALFRLNDGAELSLLGGIEWLNYDTTRSGGAVTADYDALRYLADAQVRGIHRGDGFFIEYSGGLRFIHEQTSDYWEMSGGVPGAYVAEDAFSTFDALSSIKLGVPMGSWTPFAELSGGLNLYNRTGAQTALANVDGVTGRLSLGVDADVAGGLFKAVAGFHSGSDGVSGVDGRLSFSKHF